MNPRRLKELREARFLTQQDLAERVPCSISAVSAHERGLRKRPPRAMVGAFARALEVDEAELSDRPLAPEPNDRSWTTRSTTLA
jgi:transcriptional regulator with XRE-family HTH domain